jgi:hypothetical protein
MEPEKKEMEKYIEILRDKLTGSPSIDAIVAGIFISNDFTKAEKVADLMINARGLMSKQPLKKEEELILFEEMIHKLFKIQSGDKSPISDSSQKESERNSDKIPKRELKSQRKIEEEKRPLEIAKVDTRIEKETLPLPSVFKSRGSVSHYVEGNGYLNKPLVEEVKEKKGSYLKSLLSKKDEDSIVKSFTIL